MLSLKIMYTSLIVMWVCTGIIKYFTPGGLPLLARYFLAVITPVSMLTVIVSSLITVWTWG